MKYLRLLLSCLMVAALVPVVALSTAKAEVDVYTTEGTHQVNGRTWHTECEEYSQTERCRTNIMATTVVQVDGEFSQVNDWVFNNLTYLPLMTRAQWENNPLGYAGQWTGDDGRNWMTECDTDRTGRNGCRSYVEADVVEAFLDDNGARQYRWVSKWVFNNMVRFYIGDDGSTDPTAPPTDPTDPPTDPTDPPTDPTDPPTDPTDPPTDPTDPPTDPTDPPTDPTDPPTDPTDPPTDPGDGDGYDPDLIIDVNLRECLVLEVGVGDDGTLPIDALAEIDVLDCAGLDIVDLSGLPLLSGLLDLDLSANLLEGADLSDLSTVVPNLLHLDLSANVIEDLEGFPLLSALLTLNLADNEITDLTGLPVLGNLLTLDLGGNLLENLDGLPLLESLTSLILDGNLLTDLVDNLEDLLPVLEILDLQDNDLSSITDVLGLDSLGELLLDGNNLNVLELVALLADMVLGGLIVDILP